MTTESVASEGRGSHFKFDEDDDREDDDLASNQQSNANTIHPNDSLSETLNTQHLDIDPSDNSCGASIVRCIASGVGLCCTPSRMLVTMRILKAVTFSFLVLTIVADIMYIFFVDIMSSVGDDGLRGMMARAYGVILSVLALLLELDVHRAVVLFPGFKGFIPRALLLFLIAVITNVGQPNYRGRSSSSAVSNNQYNGGRLLWKSRDLKYYNNNEYGYNNAEENAAEVNNNEEEEQAEEEEIAEVYYNNEVEKNDAKYYQNNGAAYYQLQEDDYSNNNVASSNSYDEGFFENLTPQEIEENVPMSAVIFQIVTSWVLALCALCYFVMGIFCCDRFTAKAFMSTRDPVASTVIDHSADNGSTHYKAPEMA